jgi:hypothetical protein
MQSFHRLHHWAIALVLATSACAPPRIRTPQIEEASLDEAKSEAELHSFPRPQGVSEEELPAHAKPPEFSCCESQLTARPGRVAAQNVVWQNAGAEASELRLKFQVDVNWACERREGAPVPACKGTFSRVSATRHPDLRPKQGGNVQQPTQHRLWWNVAQSTCDGRAVSSVLEVVYIARYAARGVPAAVQGAPAQLVVELTAPDGKGTSYRVTYDINQLNLGAAVSVSAGRTEALE